jgi:hypothetical protein
MGKVFGMPVFFKPLHVINFANPNHQKCNPHGKKLHHTCLFLLF